MSSFAKLASVFYNAVMVHYEPLDPNEARRIEKEALERYIANNGDEKKSKLPPGVLSHIKSIFPFKLFPDELIVKTETITLISRLGPGMQQSRTIHFDDVAQVEADCGPIFGHLHIFPKLRTEAPMLIERISRKDALSTEKLIEEIIEAHHKQHESTY